MKALQILRESVFSLGQMNGKQLIEPTTFDRLAADSPFMLWRYYPDGEPAFANRATLDFLGYGEREILRSDIFAVIHPEDRPEIIRADKLYHSRLSVLRLRYRLLMAGRGYREILEHCRPNFDARGNLLGHFGLEIADRVKERESKSYNAAPIGLCRLDTELRYRHINQYLADYNGLPVTEHLGRTIGEVLPDVAAKIEPLLRRVIETGTPVIEGSVEGETPRQPGAQRLFSHHFHPVFADDHTIKGVTCIVEEK